MARIYFLNGVSFEIGIMHTVDFEVELRDNSEFIEITKAAKAAKLDLKIVTNRNENAVCVMLGVNIAPSYQSIYQGRTIVGNTIAHPLPPEFESLKGQLVSFLESKYKIAYIDVGIVLSQFD